MMEINGKVYVGRPISKHLRDRLQSAIDALNTPGRPVEVAQATGWHPDDAARYIRTVMDDHKLRRA